MPGDANNGSSMLDEMRQRFGPRFLETARVRIRRSLELLGKPTETKALITELHSLAGEASMLGLQALSDTARSGEQHAKEWAKGSTTAPLYCARSVRALSHQIEQFAATLGTSNTDTTDATGKSEPAGKSDAADHPGQSPASSGATAGATSDEAPDGVPDRTRPGGAGRVLVIDDSHLVGDHLCDALGDLGIAARLAMTRDAGLAAMSEFTPVMVVCDVHMPGVDLAELCTALRNAAARTIYIMLISGMSEPELAKRTTEVGADGYVSKHAGITRVIEHLCAALQELAS